MVQSFSRDFVIPLDFLGSPAQSTPIQEGAFPSQSLQARQSLYRAGDPAAAVYWVMRGHLKLVRYNELGQERIVGLVGPGDVLGVGLLAGTMHHTDDAVALGNAQVMRIEAARVLPLMRSHPQVIEMLLAALAERIVGLEGQLELAMTSVEVRVAKTLLWLTERFGQAGAEGWSCIDLGLRQEELAALVGMTRPTLTHTLTLLREMAVLKGTRGTYWIRPRLLERYLEDLAWAA